MVYDWQKEDPNEWGDDPGEGKALLLILLAVIAVGIGMWLLYTVAAELP